MKRHRGVLRTLAALFLLQSLISLHAFAAPRPPLWPPLPELSRVTYSESFDEMYYAGVSNALVEFPNYGTLRESWSGYSLERAGVVTPLVIAGWNAAGRPRMTTDQGALRFWFRPYWSSGSGPGAVVTLAQLAAVAGSQSAVLWSLQASADGAMLQLMGPEGKELVLAAKIDWLAGSWHQVVLNYGTNGTELVLDGEVVAQGGPTLNVPANVSQLVIGSSLSGDQAAGGELEEVYCFARPLKLAFHYLSFHAIAVLGPMSEAELAYREELMAKWAALKAQKAKESKESENGGGMQMLRLLGPTSACVTNSPLYITNVSAWFLTNQGWTVQFEVQGTNGPADIFSTTNLSSPLTNAAWVWLERGPSCALYEYTNQPASRTFYILGTTNDTDVDGLTDAYEVLVSHTNPNNSDTDGDGMPDGWEVSHGLNPLVNDANDDPDGDWLSNLQEYNGGTNSSNPHDLMVVAWGDNSAGQCNVPSDLRNVKAIAAGNNFSLALLNDGTVWAWGNNTYGQTNVPVTLTNATALAGGAYHSLALRKDGTATIWGDWWTQFGYSPANFPSWTNLIAVAAGADHDMALLANGAVYTWSYYTSNSAPYTQVPSDLPAAQAIAAGWDHSVALLANGKVAAWGLNYSSFGWNVTNVPAGLSNVTSVAAGAWHTLALRSDSTVAAWGAGNSNNPTNNYLGAEWGQSLLPTGLSNVTAIAAAGYHSLALRVDGSVVGWGDMGTPGFLQSNVVAIAAGANHNLAIREGRQSPLILQSPFGRPELPGSTVTYTALGLGLAGVHYQWQFNGVNLTAQTNATLTVSNIAPTNEGGYTVVISTGAGSITSSVATLTLIGPPVITNTIPTAPSTNWVTNGVTAFFPMTVQATALETQRYPLRYQWYTNGVAIPSATNQSHFFSPPWVPLWQTNPANADYSVKVWNPVGTNEAGPWTVRVISPPKAGSTVAWGNNSDGQIEYPISLTNTLAIAAGEFHSVAVREDGGVVQWGQNWGIVPPNLTNAISVAAGYEHSIALRRDGTVTTWGQGDANWAPAALAGVTAVAAGWDHNVALRTNGTVVVWGYGNLALGYTMTNVPPGLSNVTMIAAGGLHTVVLKSDGTVVSWGYNGSGETNVPSGLSNVVAVAAGGQHSLALKANGTIVAWGFNQSGQCTPPAGLSNVMAIAAGWQHSVALKNDGTVVCWGDNTEEQTNTPSILSNVKLIAAGGDHTLAGVFSPLVQYPVDVTRDLLLIYNTNSPDSSNVCAYYLAHRPMVSGANLLGIGCTNTESFLPSEYTNVFVAQIGNWLTNNPTKRPQYVILFLDIPSRVHTNRPPSIGDVHNHGALASVSYSLGMQFPNWQPFVTHLNMGTTNDCRAYIDKLAYFGTNYSPGQLMISANGAGDFGSTNINYVLDGIRHGGNYTNGVLDESFPRFLDPFAATTVSLATNGLLSAGVPTNSILFFDGLDIYTNNTPPPLIHPTSIANIAGYMTWGAHSALGGYYPTNGNVTWVGTNRWWIIETVESFNGQREYGAGMFLKWFSANAFGGTNYSNTPVGAVTHVEEPILPGINDAAKYFGFWSSGKNFAITAWNSRRTQYFQAVGDPLVIR